MQPQPFTNSGHLRYSSCHFLDAVDCNPFFPSSHVAPICVTDPWLGLRIGSNWCQPGPLVPDDIVLPPSLEKYSWLNCFLTILSRRLNKETMFGFFIKLAHAHQWSERWGTWIYGSSVLTVSGCTRS